MSVMVTIYTCMFYIVVCCMGPIPDLRHLKALEDDTCIGTCLLQNFHLSSVQVTSTIHYTSKYKI